MSPEGMPVLTEALKEGLREAFGPYGRGGTPLSLTELWNATQKRAARLRKGPEDYLRGLPGPNGALPRDAYPEALRVWDLVEQGRPGRFFGYPALFQALPGLVREWGTLASKKSISALVLAAGSGHEAASLAMSLSAGGFPLWDWDVGIRALSLSKAAALRAAAFAFPEKDASWLTEALGTKHLKESRGEFRLRPGVRRLISPGWGDPFLPHPANPLPGLSGTVDLLLARSFWRDLPDGLFGEFKAKTQSLLAEGGMAFLAPGELWVPDAGFSLEERQGVFFFRKGDTRRRANTFFRAKDRGGKAPTGPSPQPRPGPRLRQIRESAAMLLEKDPEKAKDFAIEAISSAQEESGTFCPKDYRMLAEAERALGRPNIAHAIDEAMELAENAAP
ncbi:MAG: hypothetical protein LBF40_07390 [Deltaproteobacteria bacterium]|nr:hypothetical protein [Deltaproteobacteria bacterium]